MPKVANKRHKKRKFHGNRWTGRLTNAIQIVPEDDASGVVYHDVDAPECSSNVEPSYNSPSSLDTSSVANDSFRSTRSYEKLSAHPLLISPPSVESHNSPVGNLVIDMGILCQIFSLLLCPSCKQKPVRLSEKSKHGSAKHLNVCCDDCGWSHLFLLNRHPVQVKEVLKLTKGWCIP